MSEELRAWIANSRRVFDLSNSTEPVTDDDERRLHFDMADWAATYGPKLLDKVEELAGVLEVYADPNRWEIAYNVDTGDIADDRHVFVTDDSEPWGLSKSALSAPKDDDRELVYIDYCSCVIPQATHAVPTRCYACGREIKSGGGEI